MIHPSMHLFFLSSELYKIFAQSIKRMKKTQKPEIVTYLLLILGALVCMSTSIKLSYKLDKHQLFCFH